MGEFRDMLASMSVTLDSINKKSIKKSDLANVVEETVKELKSNAAKKSELKEKRNR